MRRFAVLGLLVMACSAPAAYASPDPRIVGGEPTTHPWPAQAHIGVGGGGLCGGTLVAPRWVLTAGHCVSDSTGNVVDVTGLRVTLGSARLDGAGGTTHAVAQIRRMPDYDAETLENDAALLRLSTASRQTPLQIISSDSLPLTGPGSSARVIGWGTTSEGGGVSEDLLGVDVPIVSDAICGAPASYGSELVGAVMLCAGAAAGGIDACQGDSGGPLMINTGTGSGAGATGPVTRAAAAEDAYAEAWKLAGIVSWGDGCGEPDKYGVYTELANTTIRAWIYATIGDLATGLQNPSFEQPLQGATNWNATVYDADGNVVRSSDGACASGLDDAAALRRICRVGSDSFTVLDDSVSKEITINPLDGMSMLRLGGPFTSATVNQERDRYVATQTFVVDPANPVLRLNYTMLTFDYPGLDELRMRVRLFGGDGDVVFNTTVGAFGSSGDTSLKSTGWRSATIDLTPHAGDRVTLRLDAGGTTDARYGTWTYVDAGTAPNVVGPPSPPAVPSQTPTGAPVIVSVQHDPDSDRTNYNFAASSVAAFEGPSGGCLLFKLGVPITPGAGTVSDVSLLLDETAGGSGSGSQSAPLDDPAPADGVWTVPAGDPGLCARPGALHVAFTLTQDAVSQDFVVPLGEITLIEPQGVVYDAGVYATAVQAGDAPEQARAQAALGGATVVLERKLGGFFGRVLSGDPGIDPQLNPQTTPSFGPAKGSFQWNAVDGVYRVRAVLAGYVDAVSAAVTVPPPALDLHVPMVRKRPAASFTIGGQLTAGTELTLTSTSTHPDGAGAIASAAWDFDDDGTVDANGGVAHVTYPTTGTRTIRLTVTDGDGDRSSTTAGVDISAAPVTPTAQPPPAAAPPPPPVLSAPVAPATITRCAGLAGAELTTCDDPAKRSAARTTPLVDLRIAIAASDRPGAPSRTWRLRCDPNGGDWPGIGAACRRLTAHLLRPLKYETRDLVRITSQPLRISGRAFGRTVSLRFPARGSGTRRTRLRQLRTALGAQAFRTAQRRSR